jgi:hypothetical protein
MNIEFRIAKLERLLSDVSLRRARVPMATPDKPSRETAIAGWDSLERGFRTALHSLKQQRADGEVGFPD